jgi:hypothetical protein
MEAAHAAGIRALFLVGGDGIRAPSRPELADVRIIASFSECLHAILT